MLITLNVSRGVTFNRRIAFDTVTVTVTVTTKYYKVLRSTSPEKH